MICVADLAHRLPFKKGCFITSRYHAIKLLAFLFSNSSHQQNILSIKIYLWGILSIKSYLYGILSIKIYLWGMYILQDDLVND